MAGYPQHLASARSYYAELGFDTLPLRPGTKEAVARRWGSRSSDSLWVGAPADANLAIRCGGSRNLVVLDGDAKNDPETIQHLTSYLAGLGLDAGSYPAVVTASGIGRHFYLSAENEANQSYYHLAPEFGIGEVRVGSGAYVAAPPSVVDGTGAYRLIAGDFAYIPELDWKDIQPLIKQPERTSQKISKKKLSRLAKSILHGNVPAKYASRSEADMALILALAGKGYTFEEVLGMFNRFPTTGRYFELRTVNPDRAYYYIRHTYEKAKKKIDTDDSEGRKQGRAAKQWALSRAWPGRTGATDRDVFLAHAEIAYRCGRTSYQASARELAELANVTAATASKATRRLVAQQLLKVVEPGVARFAARYSLGKIDTLLHYTTVKECINLSSHDAFSFNGLGKTAAQIWQCLQERSMREEELVERTGRTKKTIEKRLKKMGEVINPETGEVVQAVVEIDGVWQVNEEVDLDEIAEMLGVAGRGEKRRQQHQKQRVAFKNRLAKLGDSEVE